MVLKLEFFREQFNHILFRVLGPWFYRLSTTRPQKRRSFGLPPNTKAHVIIENMYFTDDIYFLRLEQTVGTNQKCIGFLQQFSPP